MCEISHIDGIFTGGAKLRKLASVLCSVCSLFTCYYFRLFTYLTHAIKITIKYTYFSKMYLFSGYLNKFDLIKLVIWWSLQWHSINWIFKKAKVKVLLFIVEYNCTKFQGNRWYFFFTHILKQGCFTILGNIFSKNSSSSLFTS